MKKIIRPAVYIFMFIISALFWVFLFTSCNQETIKPNPVNTDSIKLATVDSIVNITLFPDTGCFNQCITKIKAGYYERQLYEIKYVLR